MSTLPSDALLRQLYQLTSDTLIFLEQYDLFTKLPNFIYLRNYLHACLLDPSQQHLSVLLCNIDNFKIFNAIHGSKIADQLLVMIAERLQSHLFVHEFLAHKSGDEFIIILPTTGLHNVSKRAEQILASFEQPFCFQHEDIYVSLSLGISRYLKNTHDADTLLTHADIALQQAKELGKNQYQFYSAKKLRKLPYLRQLQRDLPFALTRKELQLYYQPQFNIKTRTLIGIETLLRWKHPQLGFIKPEIFIPLMEHSGLIFAVSIWVLTEACIQTQKWHLLKPDLKLAVNISANQLSVSQVGYSNPFLKQVQNILKKTQFPAELLEFEITENIMIRDVKNTNIILKKLKALGIRLACDDFGIGYASFQRIKQLPVETIKIDKSLIDGLLKKSIDLTIVKSIIDIAKQLQSDVIAEGVASDAQAHLLEQLGCVYMQGYYLSKPMRPEKITALLLK